MSLNFAFSKQTLDLLYEAGWKEDYNIDTIEYERLLLQYGYPIFPVVLDLLQSFGGLKILYPHFYVDDVWRELELTIPESAAKFQVYNAFDLNEWLGTSVCLVGSCYDSDMPLFMSARGNVYGVTDTYWMVGSSGPDAIEALCTRRELFDTPQGMEKS